MPRFRYPFLALAACAGVVGASLAVSLDLLDHQAREAALERSRMLFAVIETTRVWNAQHGGVYVPVTEQTPPNPWLKDPMRDVMIEGRAFTKVNPAYMTRQISELVRQKHGVAFHLTSRKPIRPENGPDAWEERALTRFESGTSEVIEALADPPVYRYMAPLHVVKPCLICHEVQGYKLGDVRGGISVTVPAAQIDAAIEPQRRQILWLHGIGFVVLSTLILALFGSIMANWRTLEAARDAQQRMVAERTAELEAANAELARSNAELENFAYVASHDLQEPLRMVGAYAQLIGKRYAPALDPQGMEFLGFMTDGAERMKSMIDDLLAYSRVGRGPSNRAPVRLDDIVDAALLNLGAALTEAEATVERPLPLPEVDGEGPLLMRLMQNLIGNALKYRRPEVAPRVAITAQAEDGHWCIGVADNGMGVPDQGRERIFQVFQRLHSRDTIPGTGMGLAIAKKVVERHGGRIWVEGNDQGGATFCFTLPRPTGALDGRTGTATGTAPIPPLSGG